MTELGKLLRSAASPLTGGAADFDPLMRVVGNANLVLLGEASHGTHEFYRARALITKRLITEKGFCAVLAEADWPDAYRVNRYVQGAPGDADAEAALSDFERFPQWMWRNADVLDFVGWLRSHNDGLNRDAQKVGFYGLDLYSLHASMAAVVDYLTAVDPPSARRARRHYACFDHFGGPVQSYGLAAGLGLAPSCEDGVVRELTELRLHAADYLMHDGVSAQEALFCAVQNAKVVKNAEQYYRSMFRGNVSSWNLRDQHMMDTLVALLKQHERQQRPAKMVAWAHNSHLGDARATAMHERGELNLGQLVRERFGREALSVGFTTHHGTVTAASDWDGPAERKAVRPALPESYEAAFHAAGISNFMVDFTRHPELALALDKRRLERAIGVIYRPQSERSSHYFGAHLPRQFDVVLHYDETRAVEPLERTAPAVAELQETYPSGF